MAKCRYYNELIWGDFGLKPLKKKGKKVAIIFGSGEFLARFLSKKEKIGLKKFLKRDFLWGLTFF